MGEHKETVEEFLARGGKITFVPVGAIAGKNKLSKAHFKPCQVSDEYTEASMRRGELGQ